MELSFERLPESKREEQMLPAKFYNRLHLLLANSTEDELIIPIRSLQYLAIIDSEEIIFVDGRSRRYVKISWDHFRPQERQGIDDPVKYDQVIYKDVDSETETRLQSEFLVAIKNYAPKETETKSDARVIPLKKPG